MAGSPIATGTDAVALAVDPMSKFVFVANGQSNSVSAYSIDSVTGALTAVAGSPFATGTGPDALAIDASGEALYVTNGGSANVSVYAINRTLER